MRPALAELRGIGLWPAIAGSHVRRLGSEQAGSGVPRKALYVGDRLDNDISPAVAAGMRTVLIRRGPWGTIQQDGPAATDLPTFRIGSLAELVEKIAKFNAAAR
ncbi:HAD hydrolase-like protein [Streptomyces aureoversilis]|uniref:HAD hydrolase-like protein n=1 Tax=Streptomyces aureoversilis TaxID=67277 RepID=A0ABW0A1N0_9ACTN